MSLARKIALLAMTVVAAMAFAATNASAQESEVEVINEPSGAPCAPCTIVLTGESHIVAVPPGVQVMTCEDTFNVTINHDGSGSTDWSGASHGAPGCNVVDCSIMDDQWPLHGLGELGDQVGELEHLTAEICLASLTGGPELECAVELDIEDLDGDPHEYEFSTVQNCANGARRFELHAFQTGGDAIEFDHHDDDQIN